MGEKKAKGTLSPWTPYQGPKGPWIPPGSGKGMPLHGLSTRVLVRASPSLSLIVEVQGLGPWWGVVTPEACLRHDGGKAPSPFFSP
jgi:hypothetical protein